MKRPYNRYGHTSKDLVQSNLDPILEHSDAINGIRNNEDFDVNWIMEKTIQQADVQEWHEHMKTCHNGFLGRDGCRMCYPAGEVNATGPVLLVPKDSDDSNDGGRYDGEADMYDDLLESDEHVLERYFGIPICDSDEGSYGGNEDDGNYGVGYGEIRMEEEEMEYDDMMEVDEDVLEDYFEGDQDMSDVECNMDDDDETERDVIYDVKPIIQVDWMAQPVADILMKSTPDLIVVWEMKHP